MWANYSCVFPAEVAGLWRTVDPARAQRAVILVRDPEGQSLGVKGPHAVIVSLWCAKGAAVRGGGRDEVVQEKVKGQYGTGQTQDGQQQKLKFGKSTDVVQYLFKPHVDRMEKKRFRVVY